MAKFRVDEVYKIIGIGIVLIGVVEEGTVKLGDDLYFPSGKKGFIKSIESEHKRMSDAGVESSIAIVVGGPIKKRDVTKGDICLIESTFNF